MTKTAFIFPGQGSQSVGMLKELTVTNEQSAEVFKEADSILGFKLSEIIFNGPAEKLNQTEITQPAILTASIAMLKTVTKQPAIVAGHSLGEYSALVAAGALSFDAALKLVSQRGQYMTRAGVEGGMAAILGLEDQVIEETIAPFGEAVQIANYNCPKQVVISGQKEALAEACQKLLAAGAKRAVILAVSGPFHSGFMKPAAEKFKELLNNTVFERPLIPIIANVTAEYMKEPSEIKELLYRQMYSSVLWTQSVKKMAAEGITDFQEIGPGSVLTGLVKKIVT